MRKTTKKLLILQMVFTFFVLMTSPVGFVLCHGQDGHVEIEQSMGGACSGNEVALFLGQEVDSIHLSEVQYDHCGTCNDYPLLASFQIISNHPKYMIAERPILNYHFHDSHKRKFESGHVLFDAKSGHFNQGAFQKQTCSQIILV